MTLLEDTDPIVVKSIDSYIRSNYGEVSGQLRVLLDEQCDSDATTRLLDKYFELSEEMTLDELSRVVREDDEDYVYEWFLVGRLVSYSADYDAMYAAMLSLAGRVENKTPSGATPAQKIAVMNRIFFKEDGFVPMEGEDIPLWALLPFEVLESKKGIPLVIEMIYVFVADMLGYPLGMYVRDGGLFPVWEDIDGNPMFFIDLEHEGKMLMQSDVVATGEEREVFIEDLSVLLEIYAVIMSDVFSASGEENNSRLMMKAHAILADR